MKSKFTLAIAVPVAVSKFPQQGKDTQKNVLT